MFRAEIRTPSVSVRAALPIALGDFTVMWPIVLRSGRFQISAVRSVKFMPLIPPDRRLC